MSTRFSQSFKVQAVEKALRRRGSTTLSEIADSLGVAVQPWASGLLKPETKNLISFCNGSECRNAFSKLNVATYIVETK